MALRLGTKDYWIVLATPGLVSLSVSQQKGCRPVCVLQFSPVINTLLCQGLQIFSVRTPGTRSVRLTLSHSLTQ